MKPIFCIVGETGAGKSTLLNILLKHKKLKLYNLVYSTTRAPRNNETNGKDYNFKTHAEYRKELNTGNIIESREYNTIDNGKSIYYTTKDEIEKIDDKYDAIICAASVDQAIAYMNKYDNVYFIIIDTRVKTRMMRILNDRISETDNEACLELCRRIINEDKEFNKIWKVKAQKDDKCIVVNNTNTKKRLFNKRKRFNKVELNLIIGYIKYIKTEIS